MKLELHDDVLIVERLIRTPAGLPVSCADGGCQTEACRSPWLPARQRGG